MLGLTAGEFFVVVFIVAAVLTASWWPRAGEAIAVALRGERDVQSSEGADAGEDRPSRDG